MTTFLSPDMCQGVYFHNRRWNNKGGASQTNIMLLWKYGLYMVSVQKGLISHRSGRFLVDPGGEFCSQSDAVGRWGIVKKAISWQTMTMKDYTWDCFVLLYWKDALWLHNDSTTKKPSFLFLIIHTTAMWWRRELWTPEYISCFSLGSEGNKYQQCIT